MKLKKWRLKFLRKNSFLKSQSKNIRRRKYIILFISLNVMCGIFGIVGEKINFKKATKVLANFAYRRGKDSRGCCYIRTFTQY